MSIDDLNDVSDFQVTATSSTSTASTIQHSNSLCDLDLLDLEDDEWLFAPKKLTQSQKSIRPLTWLTQADDSSSDDDDDASEPMNPAFGIRKKKTHPLFPYIPYTETAGDFAPWRRRGSAQSLCGSTHSTISTTASSVKEAVPSTIGDFPMAHVGTELGHRNVVENSRDNSFDIRSAIHFYNKLSMRDVGGGKSDGCEGMYGDSKSGMTDMDSTTALDDDLWKHNTTSSTEKKTPDSSILEQRPSRRCSASSSTSASSSRTHISANESLRKIPSSASMSSSTSSSPRPRSSLPIPNSPSSSTSRIPPSSSTSRIPPSSSTNRMSSPLSKNHSSSSPSLSRPPVSPKSGKMPIAVGSTHAAEQTQSPSTHSPTAARQRPTSLLSRYATPPRSTTTTDKSSLLSSRNTPTNGPRHVRSSPNLRSPSAKAVATVPTSTSSSSAAEKKLSSVERISGNPKSDDSKIITRNVDPVVSGHRSPQRPDQSKLPVPRTSPTVSAKSALARPASFRIFR